MESDKKKITTHFEIKIKTILEEHEESNGWLRSQKDNLEVVLKTKEEDI